MITVLIYTESRFSADRTKIRTFVNHHLDKKVFGSVEVSISIVGDRKMKLLNTKYRNTPHTTDVLSFPLENPSSSIYQEIHAKFSPEKSSPDKVLRLGDIVISYPQTVLEAAAENKLVDQKMQELIAHGLDHLLGIHHE